MLLLALPLLALPIGLAAWYWGKLLGRFAVVFLPVVLAMQLKLLLMVMRQKLKKPGTERKEPKELGQYFR